MVTGDNTKGPALFYECEIKENPKEDTTFLSDERPILREVVVPSVLSSASRIALEAA
ncbi:hypothetical protein KTT_50920 [Tengunoibacter tsumagoiensis]|uniref:Uncharacterized protein n=1 Tax=Tengunoibacter tsumagoiensis TaxID=2014871 RepID=A0A402A7W5_9CHLR|nr:hypothetical protein KTT_50920 [Tengunoibacter tsumagoiensis]